MNVKFSARTAYSVFVLDDPDTVAAKERVLESHFPASLHKERETSGGVAVHYAFGAASGALCGAVADGPISNNWVEALDSERGIWLAAVELILPTLGLTRRPQRYRLVLESVDGLASLRRSRGWPRGH
jgi:hypothetical protein